MQYEYLDVLQKEKQKNSYNETYITQDYINFLNGIEHLRNTSRNYVTGIFTRVHGEYI